MQTFTAFKSNAKKKIKIVFPFSIVSSDDVRRTINHQKYDKVKRTKVWFLEYLGPANGTHLVHLMVITLAHPRRGEVQEGKWKELSHNPAYQRFQKSAMSLECPANWNVFGSGYTSLVLRSNFLSKFCRKLEALIFELFFNFEVSFQARVTPSFPQRFWTQKLCFRFTEVGWRQCAEDQVP